MAARRSAEDVWHIYVGLLSSPISFDQNCSALMSSRSVFVVVVVVENDVHGKLASLDSLVLKRNTQICSADERNEVNVSSLK